MIDFAYHLFFSKNTDEKVKSTPNFIRYRCFWNRFWISQPAKLQKNSVEECIFDYMALHVECRFNKNSLLRCYFSNFAGWVGLLYVKNKSSTLASQRPQTPKSNTGGVSFRWIGIRYAMLYTQKYTPPHTVFYCNLVGWPHVTVKTKCKLYWFDFD